MFALRGGRLEASRGPAGLGLGMPAVVQALEGVGLGRYAAAFEEQGYDDLRYLRTMDAAERATVAESVGMKQGHADKFVKFAFEPA